MSDKVLSLDFLLEPVKPAGVVRLLDVDYELMSVDILEDFLTLAAMADRAAADMPAEDDAKDTDHIIGQMEELRASLRRMILLMVPGMPEKVLTDNFPKLGQLQKLFTLVFMEVQKSLPEGLKKNSPGTAPAPAAKATEKADLT